MAEFKPVKVSKKLKECLEDTQRQIDWTSAVLYKYQHKPEYLNPILAEKSPDYYEGQLEGYYRVMESILMAHKGYMGYSHAPMTGHRKYYLNKLK